MRFPPIVFLVCLYPMTAWSQNQERNLIDRLLRPQMDLRNDAQGKKFPADSQVPAKNYPVGRVALRPSRAERSFVGVRTIAVQEYASQSFQKGSGNSPTIQTRDLCLPGQLTIPSVHGIRARDANLQAPTRNFADGKNEFREQGKSQKSLNRQNPPLTIDQVRELLNKNK